MSHREDREKWYEAEVRRNAYRLRAELLIEDATAYLASGGDRQFLCRLQLQLHHARDRQGWRVMASVDRDGGN